MDDFDLFKAGIIKIILHETDVHKQNFLKEMFKKNRTETKFKLKDVDTTFKVMRVGPPGATEPENPESGIYKSVVTFFNYSNINIKDKDNKINVVISPSLKDGFFIDVDTKIYKLTKEDTVPAANANSTTATVVTGAVGAPGAPGAPGGLVGGVGGSRQTGGNKETDDFFTALKTIIETDNPTQEQTLLYFFRQLIEKGCIDDIKEIDTTNKFEYVDASDALKGDVANELNNALSTYYQNYNLSIDYEALQPPASANPPATGTPPVNKTIVTSTFKFSESNKKSNRFLLTDKVSGNKNEIKIK